MAMITAALQDHRTWVALSAAIAVAATRHRLRAAQRAREDAERAHAARWTPGVDPSQSAIPEARAVIEQAKSFADLLVWRAKHSPDRVAHWQRDKFGDPWEPITFAKFLASSSAIAGAFADGIEDISGTGFNPGDDSNGESASASASSASAAGVVLQRGDSVAIAGPSRSEWLQLSQGAQLAGAVTVGVYPKQSPETLTYLLENSRARVFVSAEPADLEKAIAAKKAGDLPELRVVAAWTDGDINALLESAHDAGLVCTSLVQLKGHAPLGDAEREARRPESMDDTCVLIYTSGTTGNPKGAMVTHRNIVASCESALGRMEDYPPEARVDSLSINYLPMAHSFEQIILGAPRMAFGLTCVFNTSIAVLFEELAEVKPTGMAGVPRMFEKMYVKIMAARDALTGAKRRVFDWAEGVARQVARFRMANDGARSRDPLPFPLSLQFALADRLVFSKIRAMFGGRVKSFGTGAAPIAPPILEFFWGIGTPIFEGWGMTEIPAPAIANKHGRMRVGTIGVPAHGVEVRLGPDGEILVHGAAVFKGYFNKPEETAATFFDAPDGKRWLKTGDIGEIDSAGFVKIVDRKKHIIITAGGKNIAPAGIEKAIKSESPLISNLHVHGDRRPYVSALVCPSPAETLEFGARHGLVSKGELEHHLGVLKANPVARGEDLAELTAKVTADERYSDEVGGFLVLVRGCYIAQFLVHAKCFFCSLTLCAPRSLRLCVAETPSSSTWRKSAGFTFCRAISALRVRYQRWVFFSSPHDRTVS
jgi:long-chain acyl-CoA synthetase